MVVNVANAQAKPDSQSHIHYARTVLQHATKEVTA